jgi:hypothetical protein
MHPCHHGTVRLTGDFGTSETGAPMHGLGPGAIERDILDTFNDGDPVSLGGGARGSDRRAAP